MLMPVYEDETTRLYHCDHATLAAHLRETGETVDALIVDAPYSARTHSGHDGGADDANRGIDYRSRVARPTGGTGPRRSLSYDAWSCDEVEDFIDAWHPLTSGWLVSLTDDVLFPTWKERLREVGRTVFADVVALIPGMTVRLAGDGPSSWAIHVAVARPKSSADGRFPHWGTRPGGYFRQPEAMPVVGGKPLLLMRDLVRDYSRPGDLVCDPCMGAGTTLLAAKLEGRRGIGCDIDEAHVKLAVDRLSSTPVEPRKGTLALFGSER